MIGGWPPEQEGATMLEKPKQILAELQVDIDLSACRTHSLQA